MSFETERILIEERLSNLWTKTEISWPNSDFISSNEAWIKPTIISGNSKKITLNEGVYEFPNTLLIEVFIKKNTGTGLKNQIFDELSSIFSYKVLNRDNTSLHFKSIGISYAIEDGNYQKTNVMFPFDRLQKGV